MTTGSSHIASLCFVLPKLNDTVAPAVPPCANRLEEQHGSKIEGVSLKPTSQWLPVALAAWLEESLSCMRCTPCHLSLLHLSAIWTICTGSRNNAPFCRPAACLPAVAAADSACTLWYLDTRFASTWAVLPNCMVLHAYRQPTLPYLLRSASLLACMDLRLKSLLVKDLPDVADPKPVL